MKNLFTPLALLLLPSFNLKAQNVISVTEQTTFFFEKDSYKNSYYCKTYITDI